MNQVAMHQNNTGHLLTKTLLPERLCSLLSEEKVDWSGKYVFDENGRVDPHATAENGVRNVVMNTAPVPLDFDKSDLMGAREALELAMLPPTRDEFAIMMTALGFHCGMQSKPPQTTKMMLSDYWQDFGHYPRVLIEKACASWRKMPSGNDWMPGSGDMLKLMAKEMHKLQKMQDRLKIMLGEKLPEKETVKRAGMISLASILG